MSGFAPTVLAQAASSSGFYGGITYREPGSEAHSMSIGIPTTALSRFTAPAATLEESNSRALVFGGYRWNNDVTVEAAVHSSDPYTLRPPRTQVARGGMGVMPAPGSLGLADVQARSLNVDLYTSWNFYRSFALYGRLGYAQSDVTPALGSLVVSN